MKERITITKERYEELIAIEKKVLEEVRKEYYRTLDKKYNKK